MRFQKKVILGGIAAAVAGLGLLVDNTGMPDNRWRGALLLVLGLVAAYMGYRSLKQGGSVQDSQETPRD